MKIFNDDIAWLRTTIESKSNGKFKARALNSGIHDHQPGHFSKKGDSTIVFSEDTWLELGNPSTTSMALALVTDRLEIVQDGMITLIGPDIPDTRGSLPFAQILLIASKELQDEDYRKINTYQYELELNGYMIKTIPSSLSLWSRVSKKSATMGFSFAVLGKSIIDSYKRKFNNPLVEVVFVTSTKEDVEELEELRQKVARIISAMNKMMEELSFDCSSCEYLDVCGDVRQLGALRDRLIKQKRMDTL